MSELAIRISNILSFLLEREQITESELGRKISVPRATINRLATGATPDPRTSTLEAIARYFDISIDQLVGNQPILMSENERGTNELTSIPIINWEEATNWENVLPKITPNNYHDWIITDVPLERNKTFALKVKGDSMWPQFQENTTIIVDAQKRPKNREFVVVYVKNNDDVLLRQFIVEGKYQFIKAVNELFPTIELSEEDKILGCVIQARKDF